MRRHWHLQSIAAAARSSDSTAAYCNFRPREQMRGAHSPGQGYSKNLPCPESSNNTEFVSGDSNYHSLQDANTVFWTGQPCFYSIPQHTQSPIPASHTFPVSGMSLNLIQQSRSSLPAKVHPPFGNNKQSREKLVHRSLQSRLSKQPDYRSWEHANPGPPADYERFIVLSYNILADYLVLEHWQLYSHIPRYILEWSWRKRRLCIEIGLWSADILCLQEVDRFHDIEAELKLHGYIGIWKMRTGDHVDGCATFWRACRFKLIHEESLEYNKIGLRDNVAQICVLESLSSQTTLTDQSAPSSRPNKPKRVVVCNIHVLYNPNRGDIKLGQIRSLLERAEAVSNIWDGAPIIICGDFNSTPKSPIYNFVREQKLDLSKLSRYEISGQAFAKRHLSWPSYYDCRKSDLTKDSAVVAEIPISALPENHNDHEDASSTIGINRNQKFLESNFCTAYVTSTKNYDASMRYGHTSCDSSHSDSVDKNFEGSSVCEVAYERKGDKFCEDRDSFLSELHNTGQSYIAGTGNSSSYRRLEACGDEILSNTIDDNQETGISWNKGSNTKHVWTPMELMTATGDSNCKVMRHSVKLSSAYAEIQSQKHSFELRDYGGEPLVTSYHRKFSGTVDYIWFSEGLQASKVLSTIPKQVMEQTPGFPTKKWGSDHIALVSELAFTEHKF